MPWPSRWCTPWTATWSAASTACTLSAASTKTLTPLAPATCRWPLPTVRKCPRQGNTPVPVPPNRFYMYGVIGRLAMLAASYELEATDPDAEVYD